jgi:uroporphyrinogen III methyltransferase/synthase
VREAVAALRGGRYDVLCITSPNGAELLMQALADVDLDARSLAGTTVAAIGPGTARALHERGVKADLVPPRSVAESLAESLIALGVEGRKVLVARASEARDVLPEELERAGAHVTVVSLYDTVREKLDARSVELLGQAGYVTFTSSSTVRFLLEAIGGSERFPAQARVVSIGPVTSETARGHGLTVHVEAERHDVDGLVEALLADALSPAAT